MSYRRIALLQSALIATALLGGGCSQDQSQSMPNFELIITLSGLHFQKDPTVVRWWREPNRSTDAGESLTVIFDLDEFDASGANKCNGPGYQKGMPKGSKLIESFFGKPVKNDLICWRRTGDFDQGLHFFAIYENKVFYEYVLL